MGNNQQHYAVAVLSANRTERCQNNHVAILAPDVVWLVLQPTFHGLAQHSLVLWTPCQSNSRGEKGWRQPVVACPTVCPPMAHRWIPPGAHVGARCQRKCKYQLHLLPCSFTSPLVQVRQLILGRRGLHGNPVLDGLDEAWKVEGKLFVDFNTKKYYSS